MHYLLTAVSLAIALAPSAGGQQLPPGSDGPIERLQPGEYLWAPEVSPAGPVTVIVSLPVQRAYIYRNGVLIGVSTVSTGAPGYATPTGVFTILQKDVDHRSNLYPDAPMPFMQRLTWGGIALHAGKLPGYPASHGCIRLPRALAERLYGITRVGMTVVITADTAVPVVSAAPAILADGDDDTGTDDYRWMPERSPGGPVSIVVSGRDRRMIVLRNGIEIGSSAIQIDGAVTQTAAFVLQSVDGGVERWLRLPLPGNPAAGELSPDDARKARLPEGFRRALKTVLVPGVTVLVTRETLKSSGTGHALTVLADDGR